MYEYRFKDAGEPGDNKTTRAGLGVGRARLLELAALYKTAMQNSLRRGAKRPITTRARPGSHMLRVEVDAECPGHSIPISQTGVGLGGLNPYQLEKIVDHSPLGQPFNSLTAVGLGPYQNEKKRK